MKKVLIIAFLIFVGVFLVAAADMHLDPFPAPVSNNAVAYLKVGKQPYLFSMMGIGGKKTWDAITNRAFQLNLESGKWIELRPVPGVAGRLAASAVGLRDQVYLFGGYIVDAQGGEITVGDVNVYVPIDSRWYRGADMPVPVDDSVVGAYRDRYVYLISGWSKTDTVRDVQIYDAEKDKWSQGTPIPGRPVFGHAGAILGDTIVYVDGAYKNPAVDPHYIASDECWMGRIQKGDPTKIEWTKLPTHPGNARYRIAAGPSEKDDKIFFSGGTDNPYNFNGIGYDGKPSEPSPVTFAFNVKTSKWEVVNENTPDPTMDHRGLIATKQGLTVVGGIGKNQQTTAKVNVIKSSK